MRQLCQLAGIPERTDHSLRDVAPTRLAEAGVPLNIIQNQTNHRSASSLRPYINTYVSNFFYVILIVYRTTKVYDIIGKAKTGEALDVVEDDSKENVIKGKKISSAAFQESTDFEENESVPEIRYLKRKNEDGFEEYREPKMSRNLDFAQKALEKFANNSATNIHLHFY